MRYTLGMEQTPSHLNDYMNTRFRNQHGIHPGPRYGVTHESGELGTPHRNYYSMTPEERAEPWDSPHPGVS